ncbi:MAG: hypothetical protein HY774_01730 [Acidobacteria bacterium]|nr:hypothetical protein [Acidobacteriota bacterium]
MEQDTKSQWSFNERGVIAQTYSELESIPLLEAARNNHSLPKASPESCIRSVFQSVEVILLNLTDLVTRAAEDIQHENLHTAVVKLAWASGFGSILSELCILPYRLASGSTTSGDRSWLRIEDSPAFQAHSQALLDLNQVFLRFIEEHPVQVTQAIADSSVDVPLSRIIQSLKIYAHEVSYWKTSLYEIGVQQEITSYDTFVGSSYIREAVLGRKLNGDTFFTQFRGLHQVPEIITAELNDHIEYAIRSIRDGSLNKASLYLRSANILMSVLVGSIDPIAQNLTPSDYHKFRENLGVTSGSHSVTLHYHFFRDLYRQLGTTFLEHIQRSGQACFGEENLIQIIRLIDEHKLDDDRHFLTHLMVSELLTLQTRLDQWRHYHLHLPRNAVGGGGTKSLAGAHDGIEAVKKLRDVARATDALRPLAEARHLGRALQDKEQPPISNTGNNTLNPLDEVLVRLTGNITKARFENVQDRVGHFSEKCPFAPPEKRLV